jgi:hypothetical protein
MASFLASLLPGLLAANEKGSGTSNAGAGNLISSLKNSAGQIFNDLGSGKVNSWTDFGKSLARGASSLLGYSPPHNASDRIDSQMAGISNAASTNAADNQHIMSRAINPIHSPVKMHLPQTNHNIPHIADVGSTDNLSAGVPGGNPPHVTTKMVFVKSEKKHKKKKGKKGKKSK